jgi:hypothetical protein
MSEKELRETINANHLEVMTGLAAIEERFKHVPTTVEVIELIDSRVSAPKKGVGKWYTSKLAQGIGAILAVMATGLALLFRK